jgi:hypothetical protein
MHGQDITRFALQIAACSICLRTVDPSDCYRENRQAGGVCHVLCLAVVMTDAAGDPLLPAGEMADTINAAADRLCSQFCENPDHPSTATECRHDGTMLGTVGCSPDRPEDWAFDHFHAVIDDAPCLCRHPSWQDARRVHGQPVEG